MVKTSRVDELIRIAKMAGRNLLEHEALWLLREYRFPLPSFEVLPHGTVLSRQSLKRLPFPLVLKAISPHISHKTEAGAVCLDIKNETDLVTAIGDMEQTIAKRMPRAVIEGWLVRPFMPKGTEIIIGSIVDPQFGPVVMIGIGGVFTEVYRDVAFRLAPLSSVDAEEMIEDLKAQVLLDGVRGHTPIPRKKVAALIVQLGLLMHENPDISECDLNPVICHGETVGVADVRVRLKADGR